MKTTPTLKASLALLTAWSVWTGASAQQSVIDQQNTLGGFETYFSVSALGGLGQEFRPSLSSLDFVQLQLFSPNATAPATFLVNIHEGSMAGGVLGMSQLTLVGPAPPLQTRFDFASSVALTPGSLYVFEVIQMGGQGGWGARYGPGIGYAGGRAIVNGSPVNSDMVFGEGVVVPEPSVWALCLVGATMVGLLRKNPKHDG